MLNPGNGENLTHEQVYARALMISDLYTYYDQRYRSNCCPNSATKQQIKEGQDHRTEFERRYQRAVSAKLRDLADIYREELGREPPG